MIFQHYDQIILNSSLVLITQIEGPFPNEHSARLRNPGDFKEKPDWSRAGKFRRTAGGTIYGRIKVPATIGIIWGQLKTQSGRAAAPQSLRFPIKNWTAARARAWLKENKVTFIRFEPAEPRKENQGQGAQGDPGQEENKTWFNIVNANKETADVYIYEEIGGFGVDSKQFALQFNQIKASKINIHINSPGGSIFEGHAIYNTINNAKSKIIHTFIEGVAASMAAVVSLAGDVVHMAENALMMIHNPVAAVRGEQKDLKRIADVLEKLKGTIAKIYADKTGLPIETINKMMDDETWMNAGEALENKFIDKITDQVEAANVFDLENYNYKNLAIYNSIKHKLKSKNQNQEDVMNLEELKAKHPEVYEAAFNEGKTAGVEEGKQAGITEGTDAGAKAERERIQGIETIEAGEHAQIVKDNKFKPEATKDSVSALILEAENKKKKKGAQDTKKDGETTNAAAEEIDNAAPSTEEEAEENEAIKNMVGGGNERAQDLGAQKPAPAPK